MKYLDTFQGGPKAGSNAPGGGGGGRGNTPGGGGGALRPRRRGEGYRNPSGRFGRQARGFPGAGGNLVFR